MRILSVDAKRKRLSLALAAGAAAAAASRPAAAPAADAAEAPAALQPCAIVESGTVTALQGAQVRFVVEPAGDVARQQTSAQ